MIPEALKAQARSEEKVRDDYGDRFGLLFDVVRASVKFGKSHSITSDTDCVTGHQRR